ncbi:hypothetical protein Tco_0003022 [Tanacetum coccineum]
MKTYSSDEEWHGDINNNDRLLLKYTNIIKIVEFTDFSVAQLAKEDEAKKEDAMDTCQKIYFIDKWLHYLIYITEEDVRILILLHAYHDSITPLSTPLIMIVVSTRSSGVFWKLVRRKGLQLERQEYGSNSEDEYEKATSEDYEYHDSYSTPRERSLTLGIQGKKRLSLPNNDFGSLKHAAYVDMVRHKHMGLKIRNSMKVVKAARIWNLPLKAIIKDGKESFLMLIGPAMYFGLMGDGQPIGHYDDMSAGWCIKLRRLWSEGQHIPGIPEDKFPDLKTCLLYQQLQTKTAALISLAVKSLNVAPSSHLQLEKFGITKDLRDFVKKLALSTFQNFLFTMAVYATKARSTLTVGGFMRLDERRASANSVYVTVWASPHLPLHIGNQRTSQVTKTGADVGVGKEEDEFSEGTRNCDSMRKR